MTAKSEKKIYYNALKLHNVLLERYFDEYMSFSVAKTKELSPKYDP